MSSIIKGNRLLWPKYLVLLHITTTTNWKKLLVDWVMQIRIVGGVHARGVNWINWCKCYLIPNFKKRRLCDIKLHKISHRRYFYLWPTTDVNVISNRPEQNLKCRLCAKKCRLCAKKCRIGDKKCRLGDKKCRIGDIKTFGRLRTP